MVMEIASEVGVNENSLLADEIGLLSKKLEDVKSALTMLDDATTVEKRRVFIDRLNQTENYISSVKEVNNSFGGEVTQIWKNFRNSLYISSVCSFRTQDLQSTTNGDAREVEQVHKLQMHLQSLTQTDTVLNNIRSEQAEILSNPETSEHSENIRIVQLLEVNFPLEHF